MNLSKIKNDLQQLLQLVNDWHEKGVDELELDIVLERLREIYSQLRFGAVPMPETITEAAEHSADSDADNEIAVPTAPLSDEVPVGVAISLDDVFEDLMPAGLAEVEERVDVQPAAEEEKSVAMSQTDRPEEPQAKIQPEEVVMPEEPVDTQLVEVSSKEPQATEQPAKEVAVEEKMQVEEKPAPEVVTGQTSLFGDDVLLVPRTSRRTRMMSLYDDEPAPKPKQEQPQPQPMSAEPVAPKTIEQDIAEEKVVSLAPESAQPGNADDKHIADVEPMNPLPEPQSEEVFVEVELPQQDTVAAAPKSQEPYIEPQIEIAEAKTMANVLPESEPVLGEVINSDVQTIADVIKPKDTAAEQIVKGSIKELGKAVGINDRFLLIRDLFDGNSAEYERVIEELDNFDTLEDCMIYIVENFDWNPNSDGTKLMMELIERKYS